MHGRMIIVTFAIVNPTVTEEDGKEDDSKSHRYDAVGPKAKLRVLRLLAL